MPGAVTPTPCTPSVSMLLQPQVIHITLQRPKPPRGVRYFCVDPVSRFDHKLAGLRF